MLIEEIGSSCVYQWADDCLDAFLSSNCQFNLEPHINIKWIYMSCTKCEMHVVVATQSTSMSLLPWCTRAPTERHCSPVEVVLSGSEVALPGLVEIPKSPLWETSLLTKANAINTLEGSRLQSGDALDASQSTRVGHQQMRVPPTNREPNE